MYHLLLMLSWLPHAASASVLCSCDPPTPQRLSLKSVNFHHVLQWERGAGTPPDVTYSVFLHTDREYCTVVPGCERVLEPLQCDVTEVCSDPEETYHLQVTALHHSESPSYCNNFYPARDTELQTPVLKVAPCNSSLCVDVDTPVAELRSIYESFWYELKIESSTSQQFKSFRSLGRQEIPEVRLGSQYCVSIRFADHTVERLSTFSPAKCVIIHNPTHTDPALPLVLLGGFVLLGVLVLLGIFFTDSILLKKHPVPAVLTTVLHSEEQLEVSCHPAVSSLLFIDPSAPPEGLTEHCSSETDSDDEQDSVEGTESTDVAQYTSKVSLWSASGSAASQGASRAAEGPEEVDLFTLTFSRDKEADTSTALLPEMDLPVCVTVEELDKPEEESDEECFHTGYMSR